MEFSFGRICRACLKNLSNNARNLWDIIPKTSDSKMDVTYLKAFESCTGFVVDSTESHELCDECASELLISFQFKEKCTKTQLQMQKLLECKIKQEDVEDTKFDVFVENMLIEDEEDDRIFDDETFYEDVTKEEEHEEKVKVTPKTEENLVCDLCETKYNHRPALLKHYNTVHKSHRTETCPHCLNKQYPQLLASHIEICRSKKTKTYGKNFDCDICEKTYSFRSSLLKHIKKCHKKLKKAPCSHCNKNYYPQLLPIHMAKCTNAPKEKRKRIKKKGLCPICGTVQSDFHIRNHIARTSATNSFICDYCGKMKNTKGELIVHMQIIHLKIPYKCKYCFMEFRTTQMLVTHKRVVHPEKKELLKCKLCDFTSPHYTTLRKHKFVHTGEKNYKCDICLREFSENYKLKEHRASHFDDRPFVCATCGSSFKTRKTLKVHEKTHQAHNYECPVCQRTFTSNQLNIQHVKRHHPEYQLPPPGTVMNKSYRIKLAEKELKLKALRDGATQHELESIVVTEPPPLEEMLVIHKFN